MGTMKRLVSNTAFMFSANIIKKIITLVLTLIIARYFGVENFGKLSFALSFVALFSILTDFGAKVLINREIARNKKSVNKFVSNVIVMKLFASLAMILVLVVIVNLMQYSKEMKILIYISTLIQIFQSLGEPFNSAFMAFEKMKYNAITLVIESVLTFLFAILVVYFKLGLAFLLFSYLIADIVAFLIRLFYYHFRIHRLSSEFSGKFSKSLLRSSIPFGVAALLMTLYDKIDITMLSKMVQNSDIIIGLYSAAYNFLYIFEFIPIAIGAAIYPYASIAFTKRIGVFKLIFRKLFTFYFYITIPLSVGITILADKIILILYGSEYADSSIALQILIWTVVFKFQIYCFGMVLNSMNKEKISMKAAIASLLSNVVLNIFLIPKYSYYGASVATIIAELIYFIICFRAVSIYLERIYLTSILIKPVFAALVMGISLYYLRNSNLFISISASIVIYIVSMFFLKAFDKNDFELLKKVITKKPQQT